MGTGDDSYLNRCGLCLSLSEVPPRECEKQVEVQFEQAEYKQAGEQMLAVRSSVWVAGGLRDAKRFSLSVAAQTAQHAAAQSSTQQDEDEEQSEKDEDA